MLKQLDLTSDQQSQVKAIWEKEKPTLQPLMQQMRQNHDAMKRFRPAVRSMKPRLALRHAKLADHGPTEVEHARIKSEIMPILTADQKAKLAQLEAAHEARMGKHAPPPEEYFPVETGLAPSPETRQAASLPMSLSIRVRNGCPNLPLTRLFPARLSERWCS